MKVLLHSCCAPCAGQVIEELQINGHELTVYFYNPNIFPEDEYSWRFREVEQYMKKLGLNFIGGEYAHNEWLDSVKGLENEPEKGRRCEKCFAHRLAEAGQKAMELGCEAMATTLTSSPHKPAKLINQIGKELAEFYNLKFIDTIWRKNNGYKKSCELCARENFRRQNYCGCEFGRRETCEI